MLPLFPRFIPSGGIISVSRYLTLKRRSSVLAATNGSGYTAQYTHDDNLKVSLGHPGSVLLNTIHHHQRSNDHNTNGSKRQFSKYASVDHSSTYQESMASSHGVQLQLALEEGRGKDDAPFDPFSQFLDHMGNSTLEEDSDGDDSDEDIQEAEYEEYTKEESNFLSQNDENDDAEAEDSQPVYTTSGSLYRPKSEKVALRAGYPAGGQFAVIQLAGFQHKVTIDDLLVVNKLKPVSQWSVGSTHTVKDTDVLLMGSKDNTLVGLPGIKGGEVDLMVEEITRDKTLIVFKKRRRKHSRRKNGYRRQVTFLRVLDVRLPKVEVGSHNGTGCLAEEKRAAA